VDLVDKVEMDSLVKDKMADKKDCVDKKVKGIREDNYDQGEVEDTNHLEVEDMSHLVVEDS